MSTNRFKNRTQAGQALARELSQYDRRQDVIVLGLPRGGVPVAFEVARELGAPLDVLIVRKLGVPGWEELAMGAIASGGVRVINDAVVRAEGIPDAAIEQVATREGNELRRREQKYRGHAGPLPVEGKIVILVDDGIATGSTFSAAVRALRQQGPARIVMAVPVAAADAWDTLRPMVDEAVALLTPADFRAVGQWYEDFGQTTDAEVASLLALGSRLGSVT